MSLQSAEQIANSIQQILDSFTTTPGIVQKLKSRKFWLAIAGLFIGICGILGWGNNPYAVAIFTALQIISIVVYCLSEGKIDAERIQAMGNAIENLSGTLKELLDKEDEKETESTTAQTDPVGGMTNLSSGDVVITDNNTMKDPASDEASGTTKPETGEVEMPVQDTSSNDIPDSDTLDAIGVDGEDQESESV